MGRACGEDCADPHGDRAPGHFFARRQIFSIVLHGGLAEHFQARLGAKLEVGSLKSDMPVAADAENLQVDAAGVVNGLFVEQQYLS